MRVAAFVGALIGIGLIILASSLSDPHQTLEQHQAVGTFLMLPGFLLMFVCSILWLRLTILAWTVRFVAHNWYRGRDEYYDSTR